MSLTICACTDNCQHALTIIQWWELALSPELHKEGKLAKNFKEIMLKIRITRGKGKRKVAAFLLKMIQSDSVCVLSYVPHLRFVSTKSCGVVSHTNLVLKFIKWIMRKQISIIKEFHPEYLQNIQNFSGVIFFPSATFSSQENKISLRQWIANEHFCILRRYGI